MPFELGPYLAESTLGMGVLGGIISGTNAVAKNTEKVRVGSATQTEAAIDVGKEVLKNGVATAATFAVVASLGGELLVSVGVTLVVGTALKYLWDRGYEVVDEQLEAKTSQNQPQPVTI